MNNQATPLAEALTAILKNAPRLASVQTVPLAEASGRVLAEDIHSGMDVPPQANSAMDGYAVRTDFVRVDTCYSVSQRIPAGGQPEPLKPGTVARIFTGGVLPPGADAVILQEDAKPCDDGCCFSEAPQPGQHIRPQGQDIAKGALLLTQGTRLAPQDIGLLASVGVATVAVYRPLKVAVLATGDELVEPGQALLPGQIYNSNRYVLQSLLEKLGMEPVVTGPVADTLEATCHALQTAAAQADVVVSSGGVSVGEEDHVKAAVNALGSLKLWKLAIKPGKPLAFGEVSGTPFLGLPGNPVSSFVTFLLVARPFLLRAQGHTHTDVTPFQLPADFAIPRPVARQEFVRVRVSRQPNGACLQRFANQSSGVMTSLGWADGLASVPIGHTVAPGDRLEFFPFAHFF